MTSQEIAKNFLSLPVEAMAAVYGDDSNDSASDLWIAVRLVANGQVASGAVESSRITLAADRDDWRDGVTISV